MLAEKSNATEKKGQAPQCCDCGTKMSPLRAPVKGYDQVKRKNRRGEEDKQD